MVRLLRRLWPTSGKEVYLLLVVLLLPLHVVYVIRKGITLFHVFNLLVLPLYFATAARNRRPIRYYFLPALWIYLLGSVLGIFNSEVFGLNLYTLGQDLYLYLWFTALTMMLSSDRDIEYLATAWVFAAMAVIALGYVRPEGAALLRAEFTFRNPNRAAVYLMTSLFFLFNPALRGRWLLRGALAAVILWGIGLTGSLGTLTSLAAGFAVIVSVALYVRSSRFWVPGQVAMILIVMLAGYATVRFADVEEALQERLPLAFGRAPRSLSVRQQIWDRGFETFRKHPLGIGPASFYAQVETSLDAGARGVELHSDYVATLVERGVVGFLGLAVMMAIIARYYVQLVRMARDLARPGLDLWVGALGGAILGYFSYALTHEALHHDSLWVLLAMLMAQWQLARRAVSARNTQPAPLPARIPGGVSPASVPYR